MQSTGRTSAREATVWGFGIALAGIALLVPFVQRPPLWQAVSAVGLLVSAGMLPRRRRWASWMAGTCLVAIAIGHWLPIVDGEITTRSVVTLFVAALLMGGVWRLLRAVSLDDHEPLISLVALLERPARIESTLLAVRASEAWQVEVGTEEDENEAAYAVGLSPHFLVKRDDWLFAVHDVDEPYFEHPDRASQYTRGWRQRRVVAGHRAWLSIDLLYAPDGTTAAAAYRLIGPLLGELLEGEGVLGVMRADSQEILPWDPLVEAALRSEEPLLALDGARTSELVIREDDPRMTAAIRNARDHWREFVEAFERRASDDGYVVKVPIVEGEHTEFRWINVTAIENGVVYACRTPEPRRSGLGTRNGTTRTPERDVVDWMFEANGERRGGFTLDVFRTVANEQHPGADAV